MRISIAFTIVMLKMVVNAGTGEFGTWGKLNDDKCLLNTDCGRPGGLLTEYCSAVCRAGRFNSSSCTNFKDQGYAVCACEGKGDSEKYFKANCEFLCRKACTSCGYNDSYCSSSPETLKSAMQCNCRHKK